MGPCPSGSVSHQRGPHMRCVRLQGVHTVPRIFIGGRCIGGSDELAQLEASGQLAGMLRA